MHMHCELGSSSNSSSNWLIFISRSIDRWKSEAKCLPSLYIYLFHSSPAIKSLLSITDMGKAGIIEVVSNTTGERRVIQNVPYYDPDHQNTAILIEPIEVRPGRVGVVDAWMVCCRSK